MGKRQVVFGYSGHVPVLPPAHPSLTSVGRETRFTGSRMRDKPEDALVFVVHRKTNSLSFDSCNQERDVFVKLICPSGWIYRPRTETNNVDLPRL